MAPGRPRSTTVVLFFVISLSGAVRALGCTSADGGADEQVLPLPQRDPLDGATDATSTSEASVLLDSSAPDVSNPCDARAPFMDVAPLSSLSTPAADSVAHFRQDESLAFITRGSSVAFYDRQANGGWDGGAGVDLAGGNADDVRMTDDLLSAYYNVYQGGGINSPRLFVSTRGTTSATFGGGSPLQLGAELGEGDLEPFVLPDQQTIYFASTRNEAGSSQLWFAKRAGGSSWTIPLPVPGVSSPAGERRAVVTNDQRVIYFASNRVANAKLNVFVGVRANTTDAFQVSEVAELATALDEYPSWISPDLCRLYFVSERAGGPGQRDVWLASRLP